MNKFKIIALMIPLAAVLSNCSSAKKNKDYVDVKKITYTNDVKPIIENSCTPCHMPPQGRKEPFENYAQVKEHIASIIARVKLPKEDRKFMPPMNKKPALTDEQVALLVQWQQQNMPE
ncbi:hypothetical protein [Flavobacterium flavipallidum]|uniref:Cytochrome c domain-containing protein n=1 Tax=Flavobacterium flavipallidum TaxID=3139140 RepID=A0ABU9HLY5_9FLAO